MTTLPKAVPTQHEDLRDSCLDTLHASGPRASRQAVVGRVVVLGGVAMTFADPTWPEILAQVGPLEGDRARTLLDEPLFKDGYRLRVNVGRLG